MECKHCWHSDGIMLLTDPPQEKLICCHCGDKKTIWSLRKQYDYDKHGKYDPTSKRRIDIPTTSRTSHKQERNSF